MTKPDPPAWVQAAVDQRIAAMKPFLAEIKKFPERTVILTPLSEPPDEADDHARLLWERTCDCCNYFVPPERKFFTGHMEHEMTDKNIVLVLTLGVCEQHAF